MGLLLLESAALERLQLLLILQLTPQGFLCCAKGTHLHTISVVPDIWYCEGCLTPFLSDCTWTRECLSFTQQRDVLSQRTIE